MATKAYDETELALQDGTEVTLVPLPIFQLRRFMKRWSDLKDIPDDDGTLDAGFDVYIDLAGISLENLLKDKDGNIREELQSKFTKTRGTGDKVLDPKYREYLEATLDQDTIFMIMDKCGGLKMNDPKLLEMIAKATTE